MHTAIRFVSFPSICLLCHSGAVPLHLISVFVSVFSSFLRQGVTPTFEATFGTTKHDQCIALFVYFIVKYITCALSITLPIPCGIFLPLLAVRCA